MPSPAPTPPGSSAGSPRVGTARLLQAHGLRPDTDLGQHFLLDENLCDLAVRQGRVGPDDVVLEVGAGVGTLTVAIAHAARHVHTIEIDTRLRPLLDEALSGCANVTVHWSDVLRFALESLDPPPTRMVANLPYAIATPIVLESLWRLPAIDVWLVMVQREVADRWIAGPGTGSYGGPSVLLQLATTSFFLRGVSAQVFMPRPHVESALVGLERIGPGPSPQVRSFVHAAFAQRRKTLVNALGSAGADKAAVSAVLERHGLKPAVRAQELPAAMFPVLCEELDWSV